ncbi:VIT-domain-containing protein [Annulohypoxylon truncatum]|uniref:VIT-domain-containing protein n=1 Tax=Annulohypoxylon truncatum TaxID=327061 RepID=UPI00200737C7|nr:VIT-domain-containing protein [Annulohypoxylon truncatum]KAI1204994.1 VIT-domain-containing protein [Annulohypoxylon truncatum]
MTVFSAGIVWDPREPLPADIERQSHVDGSYHSYTLSEKQTVKELPDNILKEPTRNLLSPLSVSINGRIVDDAARVTVSQVFWNNADIPIPRASYVFPLPNGCTVTSFSCRIGRDKTIRAKVKPKAEAREAFRKAVAAQRTAALLEQNTPELFTASLGNIPVDTRLEAELTYVTLLKRQFSQEKNVTEFSIPTAIASRYGSAPSDIRGNLSGEAPSSFTLQLEIMESKKIIQIKSDTHKVLLDHGLDKCKASNWVDLSRKNQGSRIDAAVVKLDSNLGFLHEDFILTIETNCPSTVDHAHAWLESHPSLENQKAMMITIPSSLMLESKETPKTGEVIFLVDRSGSMEDKIEAVKSSLQFFLKGIPVGRKFNIWSFGSTYKKLWDKSRTYSSESLQLALDYVKELKSDMGGTELLPALTAMIASRDKSCPCDMIVLTDGEVWRLDQTLRLIQDTRTDSRGAVRFFSLGIGAHVSHALVQGIASRGGGYSEVIPKASTGGWEDRVVAMLKAALTTHVNTLGVKLNGKDSYDQFLASPAMFGDLNPFQGNRVYLLSKPDSPLDKLRSVVIETIKSNGDRESTTIPVTTLTQPDTIIHNLGVQAIVDEVGHPGKQVLSSTQATELACRFSLASKWTSFFLEQETPKPEGNGKGIIVHDDFNGLDDLLQPRGTIRDTISESVGQIKRYPAHVSTRASNTANFDAEFSSASIYDPLTEDSSPRARIKSGRSRPAAYRLSSRVEAAENHEIFGEPMHARKQAKKARMAMAPVFGWKSLILLIDSLPAKARKVASNAKGTLQARLTSIKNAEIPTDPATPVVPESNLDASKVNNKTAGLHREFVAKLLSYQNFNGSFNTDTKSLLGPSLAKTAEEIENHVMKSGTVGASVAAGLLTYTVIVLLLLERDLQDCKDLWDLMATKATHYISNLVSEDSKRNEFYDLAKGQLAGKRFPIKDENASLTDKAPAAIKDLDSQHPERTVVKVAPIE